MSLSFRREVEGRFASGAFVVASVRKNQPRQTTSGVRNVPDGSVELSLTDGVLLFRFGPPSGSTSVSERPAACSSTAAVAAAEGRRLLDAMSDRRGMVDLASSGLEGGTSDMPR